ncbi:MAG TPA: hypothetical protein VFR15_10890 [Chloroflexia bacterium]|nr:hypothetical protein [Chloroflexia bacterium]
MRIQILATEHWNLLATRSMTWSELFSRASMFLTVLSASVVALAFVAQATGFGEGFRLFAFVVLPVVLLLGLATYSRLSAINEYDVWLVVGMNRLRHAYLEMAPELKPYFISGRNDDIPGLWQTYNPGWLMPSHTPGTPPFNLGLLLTSTPNVIGAINSLVAGVLAALIAETLGASVAVSATIGGTMGLVVLIVLLWSPMRGVARMYREYRPRFPTEEQTGT